jgi:hypothetical protein
MVGAVGAASALAAWCPSGVAEADARRSASSSASAASAASAASLALRRSGVPMTYITSPVGNNP